MKPHPLLQPSSLFLQSFTVAFATLLLGHSAHAASATWNGTTDTAWSTAGNWSGSTIPGAGNTATFNNAGNGNVAITVGTISLTNITFDTAAAAYTLSSSAITFANVTTTAVTMNSLANQTINANIALGTAVASNTSFNNNSTAGLLTLGGNITGGTGGTAAAKTVTVTGSGNTSIGGIISAGGASSLGLAKTGAGTLTVTGANTYTGATTVNGGKLTVDYVNATGANYALAAASTVVLGGGTLEFKGKTGIGNTTSQTLTSITTTNNTGLNTFTVNKNGGTATTVTANTITRGTGSVLLFDLSSGGAVSTTNANVNGIQSVATLVKDSTGRFDFAANSVSSGPGTIQALGAINQTALLATANPTVNTNYKLDGSQTLTAPSSTTATNTLRINSTGIGQSLDLGAATAYNLGAAVLFVGANDYSINGTGVLTILNVGVGANSGAAIYQMGAGKLTISTKIGSGSANNLLVGNGSNLIDLNSSSNLLPAGANSGGTTLSNVTLRLSNSGAINLTNAGSNAIGTGFVTLGTGGVLELASGDLTRNLAATATAGGSITLAGSSAGFSAFNADRSVNLSSGGPLTWGTTSGFLGNGSTLILGSDFSTHTLDFQNTIALGAENRTVETRDGANSGIDGAAIDGKLSGILSGAGGITKTGTGTLALTGTNSYTGATSVQTGKLIVTGSIHTSSGVSVSSGATLAGESSDAGATNGKVSAITLSGGAGTGGVLAPGNGTAGDLGTLYGTSLAWNGATDPASAQMLFDLGSGNASDKLELSGAMTKGTGTIFEWDFGDTGVLDNNYTLVTAAGGFGSGGNLFNAVDFTYKNLSSGLAGSFTISGSTLSFTTFSAVPEPTSALAGILIGAGLLRRRHR